MAKNLSKGRLYLQERKANKNAGSHRLEMSDGLKRQIEISIGRRLSVSEEIRGELERIDERPLAERFADEQWSPLMDATAQLSPTDQFLMESEKLAREEALANMSPAQRQLEYAKSIKAKELSDAQDAKVYADRMADLRVVAAMQQLTDLKTDIAFSPEWAFHEDRLIDRAMQQLQTPGASIEHGLALTAQVLAIQTAKTQSRLDALGQQRALLESQMVELNALLPAAQAPGSDPPVVLVDENHPAYRGYVGNPNWSKMTGKEQWEAQKAYFEYKDSLNPSTANATDGEAA